MVIRELLSEVICALAGVGIENARFEADCIFQKAGLSRLTSITEPLSSVSEQTESSVREMLSRRLSGEPLQYILGEWEFCGLPFEVGEGVLIPRQDTETIVEIAREYIGGYGGEVRAADLCAGSGCIGISLAKLCGCTVNSYELSDRALGYLERNIALNGVGVLVTPIKADVLSEDTAAGEEFDVILTNPPYLTAKDMTELQTEVTHEPEMALYGGTDGLDFYRGIIPMWTKRLRKGGLIAAEIGIDQEHDVMRIFERSGISADCAKDACGIYRVVYGIKEN